jgi:hypothetical protein
MTLSRSVCSAQILGIANRAGKHSRATPHQLVAIGECVGFDGLALARASRLIAKADSTTGIRAISPQLPDDAHWVVIQQGRRIGLLLLDKVRGELRILQLYSFCELGDEGNPALRFYTIMGPQFIGEQDLTFDGLTVREKLNRFVNDAVAEPLSAARR